MSSIRPMLTIVLIILIAVIALLALGWIFGLFSADIFRAQTYKWFGGALVLAIAGLAISLLEDSVSGKKAKK